MSLAPLLVNGAFPRALVLGTFGGVGLGLTMWYSRRGPLIYPVYAAILAGLTALLARFPDLSFGTRLVAALAGFCMSTTIAYCVAGIRARRGRELLVQSGRLPPSARYFRIGAVGHLWRWSFLVAIGVIASAGVAFVAV